MRLKSQEKSHKGKGVEVIEAYNRIFEAYKKKDHSRQLPKSEVVEQWFLPHFPLFNEYRGTTKVRVLFDAEEKHDGKSLNDTI